MRKEIVIGILVSALLHAGILFGSPSAPKKDPAHPTIDPEQIEPLVLPLDPPDVFEKVADLQDDQPVDQVAVPVLPERPVFEPDPVLTQPIQPPTPDGLKPNPDSWKIPVNQPDGDVTNRIKDVFRTDQLDKEPVARVQVKPNYPYEMVSRGVTGHAVVAFIVTSSGDVVGAYAVSSSHREFEQPAVEAVMRWKFRPGRKDNRPVNTRVQQLVQFTLEQ